eukprot:TRINITY_DN20885_c0_g1_i2.p1 TRINITY_DN20885_c0_g1~~TRINITY_DN20885_c0_g1_i2.p1  ORF type:complete len:198 (-),score=16.66 TRINITY_DN20885_c0_g1_i2:394-987(-)
MPWRCWVCACAAWQAVVAQAVDASACWSGQYTREFCCSTAFGPGGNDFCWSEAFSYDTCCQPDGLPQSVFRGNGVSLGDGSAHVTTKGSAQVLVKGGDIRALGLSDCQRLFHFGYGGHGSLTSRFVKYSGEPLAQLLEREAWRRRAKQGGCDGLGGQVWLAQAVMVFQLLKGGKQEVAPFHPNKNVSAVLEKRRALI